MHIAAHSPLSLAAVVDGPRAHVLLNRCGTPVERLLGVDALNRIYEQLHDCASPLEFVDRTLSALGRTVVTDTADLARIPRTGPLVVVANHPYGMIDGLALAQVLGAVRPDVRILANERLLAFAELRELLIGVDPWAGEGARRRNMRGLRQAIGWLREGGVLLIFPAGAISRPQWRRRAITDPPWQAHIARIIDHAEAPVLPMHVAGRNSLPYQVAGLFHPKLKTLLQPRELLRGRRRPVRVQIGHVIPCRALRGRGSAAEQIEYLRFRAYLLGRREATDETAAAPSTRPATPIVPRGDAAAMAAEIDALPAVQRLIVGRDREVYIAGAEQIPRTLREIGRLRELTFRAVGEGTGRALDLDRWDRHYLHLFVWAPDEAEVVGAYRLGQTDVLVGRYGAAGLYSSEDLRYDRSFFEALGPALELGRSFVQPKYQRRFNSLLLLWRGIGAYIAAHPRYTKLFGMVSISNDYQGVSRNLMVHVLQQRYADRALARWVHPRRPFRLPRVRRNEAAALGHWAGDVDELSAWIDDLEPQLKGVPVLVRQYVKMGAHFLRFSVDPGFGNTADGFIVVDLQQTDPAQLKRFFGAGAATHLAPAPA